MIIPNELRMGNVVGYKGKYVVTHLISKDKVHVWQTWTNQNVIVDDLAELDPIPLNETMLQILGFSRDLMRGSYTKRIDNYILGVYLEGGSAHLMNDSMKADFIGVMPCLYLHQVQNIFFTLKGSELKMSVLLPE